MKAACPQCGADVEFRFDDTFVRVCDHCKAAVVRADRGLETLGEFADLVESASPLALFATGRWKGDAFQLVGRAQLAHKLGGSWDEWYARFDDGRWGWLSEAQGRFYLMFEVKSDDRAPPYDELRAGERAHVPGTGDLAIAEVGEATYVAAAGEIPFRLAPGTKYRYADLSGDGDAFATIDYGDGLGAPSVYAGWNVPLLDLAILGGDKPPTAATARATRLACPNCDGSIELRAPDRTMHVGCPFCGALIDASAGALTVLARLDKGDSVDTPRIPLGAVATFEGAKLTLIGWVRRQAIVDGERYPFEEYLLYEPSLGFRWLVDSDGSWSYVQPVDVGNVTMEAGAARYGGVKFKIYQRAPLVVDRVLGELYWKVTIGETVQSEDYVAPPAMLSSESGDGEINWSLGTFMTRDQVERAFGGLEIPGWAINTAPNKPPALRGAGIALAVVFGGLVIGACIVSSGTSRTHVMSMTCDDSHTPPPSTDPGYVVPANSAVCFSESFQLDGGKNLLVSVNGTASNSWISVGGDLVNDATGDVESFDRDIEYYFGVDDGESWTEGSTNETIHLDAVPAGRYVLRIELQASVPKYSVQVSLDAGVFHGAVWWILAGLGVAPGALLVLIAYARERDRWKNASP